MSQQLANLARLGVTAAVAYLVALLARQGFHLSTTTTDAITGLLLVPAMYLANAVANWLSAHAPWLGHVAVKVPSGAAPVPPAKPVAR
jgi:hypothetical protein